MRSFLAALIVLALAAPAGAEAPDAGWTERQLASFDRAWELVRDNHWDPDLGGLDWEAVRAELRPEVAAATSLDEVRALIGEMLGRLGQSHFAVLAGDVVEGLGGLGAGDDGSDVEPGAQAVAGVAGDGSTGFELRLVDDRPVVVSVLQGSPAAAAGIRPGWVLEEVDGEPLAPLLTAARRQLGDAGADELLLVLGLGAVLDGPVGATRTVTLRDGAGARHELTLTLAAGRGERTRLGHLPPMPVWIEWRLLPEGVGYLGFNAFLDPGRLMPEVNAAMAAFRQAAVPGVVLDLRGNPGGIGAMAMGVAGHFVAERGRRLGTMTTREAALDFVVFPRPEPLDGRLAILVDGLSASTSEILAGGLKDLGRARVFGARSAGMALPSRIERLPNGDAVQYAFADYRSAGGAPLEGRGVTPDVPVPLSREALLAGRDPALEAAVAWIATAEPATDRTVNQEAPRAP